MEGKETGGLDFIGELCEYPSQLVIKTRFKIGRGRDEKRT